jgi:hypothetical protein
VKKLNRRQKDKAIVVLIDAANACLDNYHRVELDASPQFVADTVRQIAERLRVCADTIAPAEPPVLRVVGG